jgi:hypothetical protein
VARRAVVVRGRCWGCPPPEVGRGATPMRLPTLCPPRGLLRLMPWPIRAPGGGGGGGGVRAASCVAVRRGRCSSWSQAGGGSTGRSGADPKLVAVWRRRGGSGPAPTPWHMLRSARASGRVLRRAARAGPSSHHTHHHAGGRWLVAAAVVRWCGAQGPVLVLTVPSGACGSCGSSGCAGPGASVRAPVLVMMLVWPAPWPAQRQSADAGARGSAVPRPRPTPVTECCRQCERRRWVVDVDCAVTSGRQECRCRRQCESACAQLELARGAQVTLPVFLCAGREDGARSPNNGHFVPRPSHPIHAQHGKGAVAVPVHHD